MRLPRAVTRAKEEGRPNAGGTRDLIRSQRLTWLLIFSTLDDDIPATAPGTSADSSARVPAESVIFTAPSDSPP
jgi:hypothetical protein